MLCRYVKLTENERDPGKAFDVQRALTYPSAPGATAPDWTPVDAKDEAVFIHKVLRMAALDLKRERPEYAERYWRCWIELRKHGRPLNSKPAGYSERRARDVRDIVDLYVEDAMYYSDCLDQDAIEKAPPRVRVADRRARHEALLEGGR